MANSFPREIRELGFVPRWSIARTVQRQSVAEHIFFVASYAEMLMDLFEVNDYQLRYWVVKWALEHDRPEGATADLPGPSKECLDTDRLKQFEEEYLETVYGRHHTPSVIVRAIVHLADKLEAAMFIATEIQLGNKSHGGHMFMAWGQEQEKLKMSNRVPLTVMVMNDLRAAVCNLEYITLTERAPILIPPDLWSTLHRAIEHAQSQLSVVPQRPA